MKAPADFRLDINNVGSMSQTLYAYKNPKYSDVEAATWQATQVSTISLTNFLGRIFIGKTGVFKYVPKKAHPS